MRIRSRGTRAARARGACAGLLLMLAAALAGCAGSDDAAAPAPTGAPPDATSGSTGSVVDPSEDDLQAFLTACESSTDQWRASQVLAPDSLSVAMGQAVPYRVTADVRDPESPSSAGPGTQASTAMVQCALGARLRSLDEDVVSVVDEGGWTVQRFDDPGTLEWAWAVEGTGPGSAQVVVEFKPAVLTTDGQTVVASDDASRLLTVSTPVVVTASFAQRVQAWFATDWKIYAAVAAALGAAVLASLKWGEGVVHALRRVVAALRGHDDPAAKDPAAKDPAAKDPATTDPGGPSVPVTPGSRRDDGQG